MDLADHIIALIDVHHETLPAPPVAASGAETKEPR